MKGITASCSPRSVLIFCFRAILFKTYFNMILPSALGSSKWSLYFRLSHQTPVRISHFLPFASRSSVSLLTSVVTQSSRGCMKGRGVDNKLGAVRQCYKNFGRSAMERPSQPTTSEASHEISITTPIKRNAHSDPFMSRRVLQNVPHVSLTLH